MKPKLKLRWVEDRGFFCLMCGECRLATIFQHPVRPNRWDGWFFLERAGKNRNTWGRSKKSLQRMVEKWVKKWFSLLEEEDR